MSAFPGLVPMPGAPPRRQSHGSAGRAWTTRATWAHAAVVLVAWALIRLRGDIWWPATVLLFLPRWLFLLPIPTLALAAWWWRRGLLWALAAEALLVAGPLMHLSVPIAAGRPAGPTFRIMTFNLGSEPIDEAELGRLIDRERIDLICFQEERVHKPMLDSLFAARGWSKDRRGKIWSRLPVVAEWDDASHFDGDRPFYRRSVARVRVRTDDGDEFVVASAHLPTMQVGFRDLLALELDRFRAHVSYRSMQADALRFEMEAVANWPALVGGDLNTPADSRLLDPLRERFDFAFERAGWGYGYTRPTSLPWTRIDHILADSRWAITRCWVGPDLGSDHLPLIAEVVLRR